jgi:aldose 1-epimerase
MVAANRAPGEDDVTPRFATFAAAPIVLAILHSGEAVAMDRYVELDRKNFLKEIDGKPVDLYTIRNRNGMVVKITNYGAKVEQILVADRNRDFGDVALGYQTIDQVVNGQPSMGAFIGRYANRIANGAFSLEGKTYHLAINNPPNSLHGGRKGSRFVVFDARQLDSSAVEMTYTYGDGEEGYPGNLASRVVYSVAADDALEIAYEATTDKTTVVNFTSHIFFNLAGDGDVLEHVLTIKAQRFTPPDATQIPTGELRPVSHTPFDFTTPRRIGERIDAADALIKGANGYDINYVLDRTGSEPELAARVVEPRSGRVLEVLTTEPGIQFYSGNNLEGAKPRDVGKGGQVYGFRAGFCLEPQHFPDSPNRATFPSTVLKPGGRYSGRIVYRFSVQR